MIFLEAGMKRDTKNPKTGRRNFQLTLGAGSVATAAAVIGAAKPEAVPASGAAGVDGKGYQDTPHVRTYYRTTRI